jgi:hypothetical protein
VNLQVAIVIDKSELVEFIHKMADPRPGGSDHSRQYFLTDLGNHRLLLTLLAEVRKHKQNPGEPLLAPIEQLIDQVLFKIFYYKSTPPLKRAAPSKSNGLKGTPHLTRTSHQVWTMLEGRGFSPAEITAPALYSSRTPRSLRLQAARGAGLGNNQDGLATAGLKPRPSRVVVRNLG